MRWSGLPQPKHPTSGLYCAGGVMVAGSGGRRVAVTGVSVLSTALPAFFHLSVMLATLLSSTYPTNFCKRVLTFVEVLPKAPEAWLVVLCVLVATNLTASTRTREIIRPGGCQRIQGIWPQPYGRFWALALHHHQLWLLLKNHSFCLGQLPFAPPFAGNE